VRRRVVFTEDELLDLAERVVAALRQTQRPPRQRPPRAVVFEVLREHFQQRATLLSVGGPARVGHRLRALAVLPVVRRARQEVFGTEDPPFRSWPEARRWLLRQGGRAVVRVWAEDLQGTTEEVRVPQALRRAVDRVAALTGWSEEVTAAHLLCGWRPVNPWRITWRTRTELFSVPPAASVAFLAMPYCQLTLYPEALSQQAWAQLRVVLLDGLKRALKAGQVEINGQVVRLRPPVFTRPEEDLLHQVLKAGLPPRPGKGRPAGAAEYWARVAEACSQATGRVVAPDALRMRWQRLVRKMPWLEGLLHDTTGCSHRR